MFGLDARGETQDDNARVVGRAKEKGVSEIQIHSDETAPLVPTHLNDLAIRR